MVTMRMGVKRKPYEERPQNITREDLVEKLEGLGASISDLGLPENCKGKVVIKNFLIYPPRGDSGRTISPITGRYVERIGREKIIYDINHIYDHDVKKIFPASQN